MKPLEPIFHKLGFRFEQLYRQDDVAMFKKTRLLDNDTPSNQNVSFEVIRVQKYPTYSIANVEIPAHESFPSSDAWGSLGKTFTNEEKAFDEMLKWHAENPTSAIAGVATGAPRGRRPSGFTLDVPKDRVFLMSDVIALYPETPRPTLVVKLAELEAKGVVKRVGTQKSATGRGKPCNQYQYVNA